MKALLLSCLSALALMACGHHSGGTTDANGSGDPDADPDYLPPPGDAPFAGTCTPGAAQCSNCIDDDGDLKIDGFDPECTGPLDNDEAIVRDRHPRRQHRRDVAGLLLRRQQRRRQRRLQPAHVLPAPGARQAQLPLPRRPRTRTSTTSRECYAPFGKPPVPQKCIDTCGKLAPPGCDCFGCCSICNGRRAARDIDINPAVSPNCTPANLADPTSLQALREEHAVRQLHVRRRDLHPVPGPGPEHAAARRATAVDLPDGHHAVRCAVDSLCRRHLLLERLLHRHDPVVVPAPQTQKRPEQCAGAFVSFGDSFRARTRASPC